MLNPFHLLTLQAVVRTGSFAEAGRVLGYTGSAVSQQIAALETTLGVELFERAPQGVSPNSTALFIAERATDTLGRIRSLEDDIRAQISGEAGHLRIGSFATVVEKVVSRAFSMFREDHPRVDIQLSEGEISDLIPLMESGELDIAITYRYTPLSVRWPREFYIERLLVEDLFLLTSKHHPLADEKNGISSLEGLEHERWISTGQHTIETAMIRQMCATAGFVPNISYYVANYLSFHSLIAPGLGVSIMPTLGYKPDPAIAASRLEMPDAFREVLLVRAPGVTEAAWHAMRSALRSATTELMLTDRSVHTPAHLNGLNSPPGSWRTSLQDGGAAR
ncbi:LysR family transcriptional regulator [Leucobacter sp. GX24907]